MCARAARNRPDHQDDADDNVEPLHSLPSPQSHIARVNTPLPKSGKYPQCRNIDPSSLFSMCPTKTPEGEGAGLLQTLTIMSHVRVGIDMDDMETALRALDGVHGIDGPGTLVFLNSDPIARCADPEDLVDEIRERRRLGALPSTLTCVLTTYGVLVTTDTGVILFPLLNLRALDGLHDAVCEAERGGRNLWTTLQDHGIVEYTDAWESQDFTVAFKLAPDMRAYTHLAPHPTSFFSTAAGTIPFANHNQAPRNTYQSNMAEQAISAPCLTVFERHEMNYRHVLWYPQKPVCTTQIAEVKGECASKIESCATDGA